MKPQPQTRYTIEEAASLIRQSRQTLPALDERQRYSIEEACAYLRISRAKLYELITAGEVKTIRDGARRYVPGTEIARRSRLPVV